jgi:signal peptidase II
LSEETILLELIIVVILLALDQVSKYLVQLNLSPVGSSVPVIDGLLQLTNVHNTGAAWGMLTGYRWLFILMTVFVAIALIFIMIRFHKKLTAFSRITLALLFAGAVGNFIDRLMLGFVRDFFDITPLFSFPVFNVADSALSIGCVFLVIDVLFLKEKSLFERISFKKEKPVEEKPVEEKKTEQANAPSSESDQPHA